MKVKVKGIKVDRIEIKYIKIHTDIYISGLYIRWLYLSCLIILQGRHVSWGNTSSTWYYKTRHIDLPLRKYELNYILKETIRVT